MWLDTTNLIKKITQRICYMNQFLTGTAYLIICSLFSGVLFLIKKKCREIIKRQGAKVK